VQAVSRSTPATSPRHAHRRQRDPISASTNHLPCSSFVAAHARSTSLSAARRIVGPHWISTSTTFQSRIYDICGLPTVQLHCATGSSAPLITTPSFAASSSGTEARRLTVSSRSSRHPPSLVRSSRTMLPRLGASRSQEDNDYATRARSLPSSSRTPATHFTQNSFVVDTSHSAFDYPAPGTHRFLDVRASPT
jgi:hypothetical protein